MKHHLYQLYYGGFKYKIKNTYYCQTCDLIVNQYHKTPKQYFDLKSTVQSLKTKGHA